MFGTRHNVSLLEQNMHWFVDGTFKVSPSIFYQVFTIHVKVTQRLQTTMATYGNIPLLNFLQGIAHNMNL